jgi:hypothetical protein
MGLLSWLRRLFRRKKDSVVSWTEPYATASTIESRVETVPVKPEGTYARIKPTPITHPSRYGKFFKKRRQPTTARKLWKKNAKIEDEDEDINIIFKEDD